jgi:hypothetical protein
MINRFKYVAFPALLLVGCTDQSNKDATPEVPSSVANIESNAPLPAKPNYQEAENDTYYYITAVSEEDRKKGKATGDVLGFRYSGKNDNGEHVIHQISDQDRTIDTLICKEPCKIIKSEDGSRTPYVSNSIIGSVFEDAMIGHLAIKSKAKKITKNLDAKLVYPQFTSTVPKAFHGRWDEIVNDKCEGREARFYFGAKDFSNFEVQWNVSKVKLYSLTEMDMSTSTYDENNNQVDTVWEFKLVDGGSSLTGRKKGASFYQKCP